MPSPSATRHTASTPVDGLSELTLGPGDRLVILRTTTPWLRLLDWLSGGADSAPPWRVVAILRRVEHEVLDDGRKGVGRIQPLDAEDVRAGLRAREQQGAELLVVDQPPRALLDEILRAQEGAGFALVLGTNDIEIARRAGGELRLARRDDLGAPTTFEAVVCAPPDAETARLVGWAVFERSTEAVRFHDQELSRLLASPPGPVEIAPGHQLAVAWRHQIMCCDTFDDERGAFEEFYWTAAWGLHPDACRLDPIRVPEGWVVLEGRVVQVYAETRQVLVSAGAWTFAFVVEGALPTADAAARVALDPGAARAF